jgi:uncharacterized repeat protein (TIGR01451 family)
VTGEADLSLGLTVTNLTPYVGEVITFTVTVTNAGPSQATGALVNDLFPAGLGYTYVGHSAGQGTYNSGTDVWTVGVLDPGASAYLSLRVRVEASGNYAFSAQVLPGSGETDPDLTNNNGSITTTPVPVANLTLTGPAHRGR